MTHPAYKGFVRRFKRLLDAALLNFLNKMPYLFLSLSRKKNKLPCDNLYTTLA